jgi:hypothetical protein
LEAERSFLDQGKEFLRKASVWKSDDITAYIDEIFVGRNPDSSIAAEHPALSVAGQRCHLYSFFSNACADCTGALLNSSMQAADDGNVS